jgi:hypothetical protein
MLAILHIRSWIKTQNPPNGVIPAPERVSLSLKIQMAFDLNLVHRYQLKP